jgi:hypothetical protein
MICDGEAIRCVEYFDRDEAFEAAGLPRPDSRGRRRRKPFDPGLATHASLWAPVQAVLELRPASPMPRMARPSSWLVHLHCSSSHRGPGAYAVMALVVPGS